MQSKIEKRIKANKIFGYIPIRDHFGSHPGRMQWDLCGHPLFYWMLKAAAESKYLEKVVIWTEMKNAKKIASEISDKLIVIKRTLEECKEPMWTFVDDLKTPKSKVWRYSICSQPEKITQALVFEPTLSALMSANCPLVQAKSIDKLIEKYFEDDWAETAVLVRKTGPNTWRKNPFLPQYLLPVWHSPGILRNRQEYEQLYEIGGIQIFFYRGIGNFRYGQTVFWEEAWEEGIEVHNEEDLELARFYMGKRLEKLREINNAKI